MWSSDYRSDDDQVGALVVVCMDGRARRERGRLWWLLVLVMGGVRGRGKGEEAVYLRGWWEGRGVVR